MQPPERHPNIPGLLRQAHPNVGKDLFFDRSAWPDENETMEDDLRQAPKLFWASDQGFGSSHPLRLPTGVCSTNATNSAKDSCS